MLDDAWAVLGLTVGEVYVLPTTKHKFELTKSPAKAEARYGAEVVARIRTLLAQAREIDFQPPAAELQALAAIDDIDPGEAILYLAAAQADQSLLATGDKKGLRALT